MMTSQIKNYPAILAIALSLPANTLLAQPHRIVKGNLHPLAQSQNDRGPVDPAMKLNYMSVILRRSASQEATLDQLLEQQQDSASPQYHRWLTPEQYAERFGSSQENIDKLSNWLRSSGFSNVQPARGRDFVVFSGTAAQVETGLHTPIHRYEVDGQMHFANAAEPAVPEDLADLVAGFRGLHDFKPNAARHARPASAMSVAGVAPHPNFYSQAYPSTNILAPDDLAAIYNVNSLYKVGIDGAGQTLAIAGQTDIDMTDIEYFRSAFNLPFNDPIKVLVPGATNPGIDPNGLGEADLDLESSGAIARNATILYVFSQDAFTSAFYTIDQALAPVLSFSFGVCELRVSSSDVQTLAAEAKKAAAEGITWLVSSGDSGAAGCEDQNGGYTSAITRMNVNLPASLPYVTAVGGSEFNEGNGNYWSTNPGPNGGTASGYIPEGGWTDESLIAQNNGSGFASSGGGASMYFTKPSWQSGPGVPNDGARDVPDVALTASWFHDPYPLVSGGYFFPNGGTSAAAPTFAGIVTLLNQYLTASGAQSNPGLGNINPRLYALAQSSPTAVHDITTGSNIVPCVIRSTQDCTNGQMGYTAGPGYDQVTGLGSVNAYNLALDWNAGSKTANSPHLVVTQFIASTAAKVGGAFTMSLTVTNEGNQDAGAFEMRAYFTTNGDLSTASSNYIYCDAKSLAAGATFTCSGTVNLGSSITAGTYILIGVADANNSVTESDRSGGTAVASSGPLTVIR